MASVRGARGAPRALLAARYGYDWWSVGRFIESTDDAYAGGNVTPIAPHVAGFVAEILVADNDYVRKGQPLIRLDDRDFRAAADRATAIVGASGGLHSLQRKRTLQQTAIRQEKAFNAKTAQAAFAKQDDQRYRDLALTAAGSRQNAERASALGQAARAIRTRQASRRSPIVSTIRPARVRVKPIARRPEANKGMR